MKENQINEILNEIASERGAKKESVIAAIETGLTMAARRKIGKENLSATFNSETGSFSLFLIKRAQELVNDPETEISLAEARMEIPLTETGDEVAVPFEYSDLGRLAAMTVRRVMKKDMEEIKKDHTRESMELSLWKMVPVEVKGKNDYGDILCKLGESRGVLPRNEQLYREEFKAGSIIQTVVMGVTEMGKEPAYLLSRTHPLLLAALFRREVPEINDGFIVIKGIARDTAGRAKLAIMSKDEKIDPVGACIGPNGKRVQRIVNELSGEKIDIIKWSEKPEEYIAAALTPAKIKSVKCDTVKTMAVVEVEEDQHSIAVGKKGLNIRLAGRLTRYSIEIK